MSGTSAPYGLRPVQSRGGVRAGPRAIKGGIPSGYATAIYMFSPVMLNSSGQIIIATTAADIIGSFAGVSYTDSNGRRQYSPNWIASQAATDIIVWVYDDPNTLFQIQSNGSLAQTSVGDQADFVNPGTGSTTTGLSTAQISSTLAGAGVQAQLRIIDKSLDVSNDWGDAYTDVIVMIARHQYVSNKVAI